MRNIMQHSITLYYTALCYTTLHCTTLSCTTLHFITLPPHYTKLQYTARTRLYYPTQHYSAVSCIYEYFINKMLTMKLKEHPELYCISIQNNYLPGIVSTFLHFVSWEIFILSLVYNQLKSRLNSLHTIS